MAPQAGHIKLTVICARGLRDTAVFGVQDPFVVGRYGNQHFKTKKHRGGGTAPVWQETFILPTQHGSPSQASLVVKISNVLKEDKIGSADISLDKAFTEGSDEVDAPVFTKDGRQKGEIQVAIKFLPASDAHFLTSTSANAMPQYHSAPSALAPPSAHDQQEAMEVPRAHTTPPREDANSVGPLGAGLASFTRQYSSVGESQQQQQQQHIHMSMPPTFHQQQYSPDRPTPYRAQSPATTPGTARIEQQQQHGSFSTTSSPFSSPQKPMNATPFAAACVQRPSSSRRSSTATTPSGSFSGGPHPQLWSPLAAGPGCLFSRSGASFSHPLELAARSSSALSHLPSSFSTAPNYTLHHMLGRQSEPQGSHSGSFTQRLNSVQSGRSSSAGLQHPQQSGGSYSLSPFMGSVTSLRTNSAAALAVAAWPDKSRPSVSERSSPAKFAPKTASMAEGVEGEHATPSAPPLADWDSAASAPTAFGSPLPAPAGLFGGMNPTTDSVNSHGAPSHPPAAGQVPCTV